jgi:hypothetical protein
MALVIRLVTSLVLVPHLSTRALDLAKQTRLVQQVEGAVDGRDPNIMAGRLEQNVDFLCTEMLPASLHEESENLLTRRSPAPAKHPDPHLILHWFFALHWSTILVILRMIINTVPK